MKKIGTSLFLVIALFLIAFSGLLLGRSYTRAERFVYETMREKGELALQFNLSIRRYVAENIRPVMYQLVGTETFIPETMSTSYVSRAIFTEVNRSFPGLILKFSADDPRNPLNLATPEELEIIRYFNQNPQQNTWEGLITIDGKRYLAKFNARRMDKSCLHCHGQPADAPPSLLIRYGEEAGFHRPIGNVIATDTVAMPLDEIRARMWAAILADIAVIGGALLLLLAVIYLLVRKLISKPLALITTSFEQACHPDGERVELPPLNETGPDEIGSLARSYNLLAAKLYRYHVSLQEQLRERTLITEKLRREIVERQAAEKERLKMERQVLHVQKLESLGVMAGGIAHDFNNLLSPIMGHAQLGLRQLPPDAPARKQLNDILQATQRAGELCRQLLAYSGKGTLVNEQLDLSRLTREMAEMLAVSISKKTRLHYRLTDDIPPVEGDATQLRQVIMNLITNASEALGDEGGDVTISTGLLECDGHCLKQSFNRELPPGTYVYLDVEDTGAGMDAATAGRIFTPFFSTKFTGRGLGLAAVLSIINSHHGAIRVYSEPGWGTVIKVVLPAAGKTAAARPEA